ncbi:MAG: thiamine pyrophosphate-binding protein [Candidatus Parcubacteria bacterium]|nr:thiamine pyrophosphate-binding protein [Burkholderiales bacterium]
MAAKLRGADIVARSLARAGTRHVFTLSGNHVMPVFDAALDARLPLVHVRHEAAAVHMADAWARITGEAGIALVTGGPGHANAVSALYTALAAESAVVLLSGHAPLTELGMGAFQEMAQAEMAAPACKASWTVRSAATLGEDLARAIRMARTGRPGPVHLSLPSDLLEAELAADLPARESFLPAPFVAQAGADEEILDALHKARKPLLLAGPALGNARGRALLRQFEEATRVPAIVMESPRGVNDPCLGLLAEVLAASDVVVLAGKRRDFTLRFGAAFAAGCRVVDTESQVEQWIAPAARKPWAKSGWLEEVRAAVAFRPAQWRTLASNAGGPLHPVEVGRAVQKLLDAPDAVLVADGGEFGQWAQATLAAPHRVINGPAGSIGAALPFAAAAKLALPGSNVVAMLGDGTFGFHSSEIETAVRCGLPYLAVVGNDACWNAEYQIQLRSYGAARAHGLELLPARYDLAAAGFGAHGEYVEHAAQLAPALERAARSGRVACVNVMIERLPAPVYRRA